jgi:hypothetical protein
MGLLLVTQVNAQAPSSKLPSHLAVKVQAYSMLSWLAEPLNGSRDFPFTPRFWTGELELGVGARRSVQASVGLQRWRYDEIWKNGAHPIDARDGLRMTLAYRDYYQHARRGPLSGPYYSPFVRWVSQERTYENLIGEYPDGKITTNAVSAGVFWGWQPHIGKHFYMDFGIGVETGYQWYDMTEGAVRVDVSTFDYVGAKLWKGKGDRNRSFIGLGVTSSIGLGWLLY